MSIGFNFSEQGVKLTASGSTARSRSKFRIVILGDFSGRNNRGEFDPTSLSSRQFHLVDPDTLEDLPKKLGSSLLLPVSTESSSKIILEFEDLDSFHPDSLYDRMELFSELRKLRRQLDNPETFQQAARELMPAASPVEPEPPSSESSHSSPYKLVGSRDWSDRNRIFGDAKVRRGSPGRCAYSRGGCPLRASRTRSSKTRTDGVGRCLHERSHADTAPSSRLSGVGIKLAWTGIFIASPSKRAQHCRSKLSIYRRQNCSQTCNNQASRKTLSQLHSLLENSVENSTEIDVVAGCFALRSINRRSERSRTTVESRSETPRTRSDGNRHFVLRLRRDRRVRPIG